ncbi:cupredoxin domain-containing protein [Bradyrhizobium algeriense]|uniref:cupredoxin domain-containing protein n=1 Tax=Bradyrhizobium algeriense TaxID=634784 RepID=UPI000D361595|nr:cupredoxin family protein [Bradyrhizobium algeriense]
MKTLNRTGIALVAALLLSASAWAGAGPSGHSHSHDEAFSAGVPGDPKKPARIVQVTMSETDGKMIFMPEKIHVKKGEQVKFMLRNNGELEHEFILATTAENLKHGEAMKKNPDMEHDDPNGKRLAPKKTDEMVWKFTKAGEFEYSCLIPGHREAGMVGTVTVK